MNEFLNTFDLLKEYNVAKGDPLGADYDEMAIDLADGKTAFWFNGNWAWPNLEEAGAETTDEYGFLPYFLNNDPDDFVNSKIQASPSKQIMLDDIVATDEQKAAAKEFLNWLVYSEIGQQMVVKTCSLIPPFKRSVKPRHLRKSTERRSIQRICDRAERSLVCPWCGNAEISGRKK